MALIEVMPTTIAAYSIQWSWKAGERGGVIEKKTAADHEYFDR